MKKPRLCCTTRGLVFITDYSEFVEESSSTESSGVTLSSLTSVFVVSFAARPYLGCAD